MTARQEINPGYGTRWAIAAVVLAPALAVVALLGVAVGAGALALTYTAQSSTLNLVTGGLTGEDFGVVVVSAPTRDANGRPGSAPTARIGVSSGRINGLCIAQPVDIVGAPFTLLIRGGDGDPTTFEIAADGLVLDLAEASGVISTLGDLQLNKNAADVRLGNSGIDLGGEPDRFGLQSSSAVLRDIVASARSVSIPDLLSVPNFRIDVVAGTRACPAP